MGHCEKKRQQQHNAGKCRETCAVLFQQPIQELACLGSFVPEGPADTTAKFVFTNFVLLSTEAPTLPVQQNMILIRLLHRITSCRSAANGASTFLCPNTLVEHKHVAGTAQRRSATHIISIVLSRGESTSPTFFHTPVRPTRSWHRPLQLNLRVMELFGLSCHVLCHGLDDAM